MTATFRSALACRDFRRLLVSHGLATTAALMLAMAVGVEVLARTGSGLWVSITVSLGFLPYVLVSGLAGVLADRYSRSRVLAWSAALRAVCAGAIALGVASSWPVAALVALAAVAAVLGTPSYPALAAATPDLVPNAQLPPANALVTAVENAAWIAGPGAMGLMLLVGGGPGPAALVATALFGQAAAIAWRVRLPMARGWGADSHAEADAMLAGVRLIIADRRVRVPTTMAVLDNFLYGYLVVAMLLLGDDVLAHATGAVGWLNAAFAAGAFAALALTNRIAAHPRPQRVLPALMVLFALSASALSLTDRLPVAAGLVLLAGASTLVAEVLSVTLLQRAAPSEVTARVRRLRPAQRGRDRAGVGGGRPTDPVVGGFDRGGRRRSRGARRLGRGGEPDALAALGHLQYPSRSFRGDPQWKGAAPATEIRSGSPRARGQSGTRPATCSGRTGIRASSRPVAARIAATTAGVEEIVGGSPTPLRPYGASGSPSSSTSIRTGGMSGSSG
jgi:MFS family permease